MPLPPIDQVLAKAKRDGVPADGLREIRRRYQEVATAERSAGQRAGGLTGTAAGMAQTGLMHAADSAVFGQGGRIADVRRSLGGLAPMMGPIGDVIGTVEKMAGGSGNLGVELEASRAVNPGSALVGGIAGAIPSATPAGLLTGAAARGATRFVGVDRAVRALANAPLAVRTLAHTARNMIGGVAGTGAYEAGGAALGAATEGVKIRERLDRAEASIPLTAGLSLVAGRFGAQWQREHGRHLAAVADKFERQTGRPLPHDILSDSREAGLNFWAAKNLGLADDVDKAAKRTIEGLSGMIREMRPRGATYSQASRGVTRFAFGEEVSGAKPDKRVGTPKTGSALKQRRQAAWAALEGAEGAPANRLFLTKPQMNVLIRGLDDITTNRPRTENVGSPWQKVVDDLRQVASFDKPLSLEELEALRKQTAKISKHTFNPLDPFDPKYGERGRVEATRFYSTLDAVTQMASPARRSTLAVLQQVRAIESQFAEMAGKVSDVPDATLQALFTGRDVIGRWRAFAGDPDAPAAIVGGAKGWLFDKMLESMKMADGSLNHRQLLAAMQKPGMLNRAVLREVFGPRAVGDVLQTAAIFDRARRGVLKESSATTAGAHRVGKWIAAPAAIAGLFTSLLHNQYSVVGSALGGAGIGYLARRYVKSMIDGTLGDLAAGLGMNRLPPTPARTAASLGAAGVTPEALMSIGRPALGQETTP